MKKLTFITTFILLGLFTGQATAASPTTAPTKANAAVSEKLDDQINQLKEKIASRVSELNLVEKRGLIGTVTEVNGNKVTLTDAEENIRFVDVDEITKFASPGKTATFGISDITKGSRISVLGIYNKQSKRLLARFVKTYTNPTIMSGAITAIDAKNFQITIKTPEQKEVKVDIDTATKVSSYTSEDGLVKYGFSKLAVGDRLAVAGSPDTKDPTILAATRVVDFIGIPKDPRIVISGPTIAPPISNGTTTPVTPTKASGKNLAPIR